MQETPVFEHTPKALALLAYEKSLYHRRATHPNIPYPRPYFSSDPLSFVGRYAPGGFGLEEGITPSRAFGPLAGFCAFGFFFSLLLPRSPRSSCAWAINIIILTSCC